jgi:hypothetical protein
VYGPESDHDAPPTDRIATIPGVLDTPSQVVEHYCSCTLKRFARYLAIIISVISIMCEIKVRSTRKKSTNGLFPGARERA